MRKIKVLIFSVLIISSNSFAGKVINKVSMEMRNRNLVMNTTGMNLDSNNRPELSYGADLNTEFVPIKSLYSITPSFGLNLNRADYSTYKLRGSDKIERNLTTANELVDEYMFSTNLSYAKGNHGANFSFFSHLGDYYFKRRGISTNYDFYFNEKWSMVGMKGLLFKQDRPGGFYLEGAKLRPYPTSITGQKLSLYYQQILPFDAKMKLEFFTGQRKGERPVHRGASLKFWKAITDRIYARMEGTYSAEKKSNFASFDGRGHFQLIGASGQLTYEPLIGLYLTAMYGQTVERETMMSNLPNKGSYLQTGLDQYGLGILFENLQTKYQFKWNRLNLSSGKQQIVFSGGVSWDV